MKIISFFTLLVLFAFPGYSQPDPSVYYADSRLDYYSNEEVGEILVYIPAGLKGRKISIDLVFEYEVLNRGYLVSVSGVSTVPFPMELLKEGQNEITVSFYEDEKWVDSRKVWVTIRPYHENAVKIDRATGCLYVDALPLVPFGFYTYFPVQPSLPEQEIVNGFNLISPEQKIDKKTMKERKAYMDRCADLGMRVNYNLSNVENRENLRKEIEMFRDHPALLTWNIADKPDAHGLVADSLLGTYKLIKEMDPYHPVSILLSSPRKAADFRDVMDIVMTAPYPVPQGRLIEVKEYTQIVKNVFLLQKPVWTVLQAFGGNDWLQREPTPREVRAMTYLAIIHGATGIQYYIRSAPNSFPKSATMWHECGALAMEIAELAPDMMSPMFAPELIPDQPEIHAKAWNRSGLVTLAVVNDQNKPGPLKLKMADLDLTIEADVMFENRKVTITDGVLEDFIDGYGTRIYRFDARQNPDQAKVFEAGNLTADPGFENLSNIGVPSACYVYNGYDPGSTYFTDSRRFYQGEHSLRLNNPSERPGNSLCFYGLDLAGNKSYTVSIIARTGPSSNKPGGKKGGPVKFLLGLGSEERTFNCTDTWQKFEINGVRFPGQIEEPTRISPKLEMAGKGTAWFDVLQVYPDMEIVLSKGEAGKLIIELKSIHPDVKIFYTIDGSEPSTESLAYMIPVEIDKSILLKAAAYKDEIRVGYIERGGAQISM